jgi:hypothetical protein
VAFQPADAQGVLFAIRTRWGANTLSLGTAQAVFPSAVGNFAELQDAGDVTLNGQQLTRGTNQGYFTPTDSATTGGLSFASGANWSVSGKGTVPAFGSLTTEFPSFPSQASWPSQIYRPVGFTLTFGAVSGADSIHVTLTDSLGNQALLRLAGTATQAQFTPADVASLVQGPAWLRVSPFAIRPVTLPTGEKFYRINLSQVKKAGYLN